MTSARRARVLMTGNASSLPVSQWVHAMQERGHEILLVSPSEPRPDLAEITVGSEEPGARGRGRLPARVRRIRRLAEEFGATVFHAHYATDYAYWLAAAGLHPLIVTCWGSDVLLDHTLLTRYKRRKALRSADAITATSAHALDRARAIAGGQVPAQVIHWGVDLEAFRPEDDPPPTRPFTVLSYRNLHPIYNIDVIISAFADAMAGSTARLRVAGDGPLRSELETLAQSLGIGGQVEFLGRLSQDEVARELRSADVCVSVPTSDATAVSNLEAMASGVALIGSELPSTREWIVGDENGLLVPVRSAESLALALSRLSGDADFRRRLGRAARQTAEQRADRKAQMDAASDLYVAMERRR